MLSRRQFFKSLGALAAATGLHSFLNVGTAHGAQKPPVSEGKVGVEWLGHGSFMFTSCRGKKILFNPWLTTNPKCPGKYRKKTAFGAVGLILWTHGHVDHFYAA